MLTQAQTCPVVVANVVAPFERRDTRPSLCVDLPRRLQDMLSGATDIAAGTLRELEAHLEAARRLAQRLARDAPPLLSPSPPPDPAAKLRHVPLPGAWAEDAGRHESATEGPRIAPQIGLSQPRHGHSSTPGTKAGPTLLPPARPQIADQPQVRPRIHLRWTRLHNDSTPTND